MFASALHLLMMHKKGLPLPNPIPPEMGLSLSPENAHKLHQAGEAGGMGMNLAPGLPTPACFPAVGNGACGTNQMELLWETTPGINNLHIN